MFIIVVLAKRIHLFIKGLTIISFTNQGKLWKSRYKRCFGLFFDQIRIPKRKRNAETFFQRDLLLYVLLVIINFYKQFLKLNFQGNNLNLSLKISYKDKITDIKKIPCKTETAVNLP